MKKATFILVVTGVLLVCYWFLVVVFPIKGNALLTNEERAEYFVYQATDYKTLLVGSSLSAVLKPEYFGERKVYNLSMPFTNANTGLELIKRTGKIPDTLFIEINSVNAGIDTGLVTGVFEQPAYSLRKIFSPLRKQHKFLAFAFQQLTGNKPLKDNRVRVDDKLYQQLLEQARERWVETYNAEYEQYLLKQFDLLTRTASKFAAKGCKVYFIEMPMDTSISNGAYMKLHRQFFAAAAQQQHMKFIPFDNNYPYTTSDGLHLLNDDARHYASYLLQQVQDN